MCHQSHHQQEIDGMTLRTVAGDRCHTVTKGDVLYPRAIKIENCLRRNAIARS